MTIAASPPIDDDVVVVKAPARSAKVVQDRRIQAKSGGSRVASRKAADKDIDKGKGSMLSTFTIDYGLDMPSGETTVAIEMRFKATDQAFQDLRLAGELARMIILPTDWKSGRCAQSQKFSQTLTYR